jgi:hypothetical protein
MYIIFCNSELDYRRYVACWNDFLVYDCATMTVAPGRALPYSSQDSRAMCRMCLALAVSRHVSAYSSVHYCKSVGNALLHDWIEHQQLITHGKRLLLVFACCSAQTAVSFFFLLGKER